jgi:hypothetical protein
MFVGATNQNQRPADKMSHQTLTIARHSDSTDEGERRSSTTIDAHGKLKKALCTDYETIEI